MYKRFRLSGMTLAVSYVLASLVIVGFFATSLWYTWHEIVEERAGQVLQEETQRLAAVFTEKGVNATIDAIESRVSGQKEGDEKYILLIDPERKLLAGDLPAWPPEIPIRPGVSTNVFVKGRHRVRADVVRTALPGGYALLVGRNTAKHDLIERTFLFGLAGSIGSILLLGVFGGYLVRRALLSAVHRISLTAAAIVGGNFSHRLEVHNRDDELSLLALTVNRMLDQIEQLIESTKNVSNAIAHDLRTPLAELRSRLEEVSLTRPEPHVMLSEIDNAISDVDRVMAIFNALLRLAEIDAGMRRAGFVEVDAGQIAEEAAEFYQPVAELKGIVLNARLQQGLVLRGDAVLLAQMIGNLLDNAIKYTQKNGTISIECDRHAGGAVEIAVSDNGPGIPDAEMSKVTDRFYRGDASRAEPGVGLGLSMVAAVARLHGGTLVLTGNQPGLRVSVTIPAVATALNLR
jgi:signal transduction histidine kinase